MSDNEYLRNDRRESPPSGNLMETVSPFKRGYIGPKMSVREVAKASLWSLIQYELGGFLGVVKREAPDIAEAFYLGMVMVIAALLLPLWVLWTSFTTRKKNRKILKAWEDSQNGV